MQRKVNYNDMELKDTILLLLMVAVLLFSVIYTLVKIMQIRAMTSNDKLDVNEVVRVGKTDKKPVLKDYDPSGEDSGFAQWLRPQMNSFTTLYHLWMNTWIPQPLRKGRRNWPSSCRTLDMTCINSLESK